MAVSSFTEQEWYERIVSFIPSWYFEDKEAQEAHARGLAAIMVAIDEDIRDQVNQTFISLSTGDNLNEHGRERSVTRLPGEFDAQYRKRVRNIKNESNRPDIQAAVNNILMVGTAEIREDFQGLAFVSRGEYVNRGTIILDQIVNAFSILIDKQIHEPYSFVGREFFADREDYVGTVTSSDYVFDLLLEVVNTNKALGTLYRVIERVGS
jgi:hypothetical protein